MIYVDVVVSHRDIEALPIVMYLLQRKQTAF